ncbi:glycine radical enzyme activase, partial [Clostridium botulinum]|nr:glycine radical enzyme activase [Clostridium botulinum]
IVPDLLDNEKNVFEISKLIASLNPNIRYKLIKYRSMGVRKEKIDSKIPKDEYMENLKNIALKNGCKNIIIL